MKGRLKNKAAANSILNAHSSSLTLSLTDSKFVNQLVKIIGSENRLAIKLSASFAPKNGAGNVLATHCEQN